MAGGTGGGVCTGHVSMCGPAVLHGGWWAAVVRMVEEGQPSLWGWIQCLRGIACAVLCALAAVVGMPGGRERESMRGTYGWAAVECCC